MLSSYSHFRSNFWILSQTSTALFQDLYRIQAVSHYIYVATKSQVFCQLPQMYYKNWPPTYERSSSLICSCYCPFHSLPWAVPLHLFYTHFQPITWVSLRIPFRELIFWEYLASYHGYITGCNIWQKWNLLRSHLNARHPSALNLSHSGLRALFLRREFVVFSMITSSMYGGERSERSCHI